MNTSSEVTICPIGVNAKNTKQIEMAKLFTMIIGIYILDNLFFFFYPLKPAYIIIYFLSYYFLPLYVHPAISSLMI